MILLRYLKILIILNLGIRIPKEVISMKALVDGKVIELTEEQIEEMKKSMTPYRVTDEQRLSALESAMADLAIMMATGGSTDA